MTENSVSGLMLDKMLMGFLAFGLNVQWLQEALNLNYFQQCGLITLYY